MTLPADMRIIGVKEFGGPEALETLEAPEPHAGPGQVRIAVKAAAVNPTDTNVREGNYGPGELPAPHIPGMDAAGIIDEVGEPTADLDTSGWKVGDKVMAMALPQQGHGGAYVEFLIADADSIAAVPSGISLEEASTLPMNALTARQALDRLGLTKGQVLAVTGAAGTLGAYLIGLAKQRGLTVIADAAPKDHDRVVKYGADQVVERGDDVAARFREAFPGGVDGLADAAVQNELALPAVKQGGGFATFRNWEGVEGSDVTVHKIWVFSDYHHGGKLDDIRQAVEDGHLKPEVASTMPAQQAADAHRKLAAGGTRGRYVLTF